MNLQPREEIGTETHSTTTQFIRIESGKADAVIGDDSKRFPLDENDVIVITPNTQHNIINRSDTTCLKLYTIYSPPEHALDTIQLIKPKTNVRRVGKTSVNPCGKSNYKNIYDMTKRDYLLLQKENK
jgi:mannose-6-phosphate isomerase-like protein (cupin superfamily)